ncbi:plastocyanin/azurin family copper-binding protein [Streptomyces sp. NPDC087903]|uniref:cupredoxin domain-containing protein n=1 Tax=Streptomyces sp. NPDC087903 TaxID=3365819 RepID=UPI00380CBF44
MPRLIARIPRVLLSALLAAGPVAYLDAPSAYAATSHQVVMSGYAFAPRALTITSGDTVTWVNQDTAPHDVKTTSGPESIHSPMLDKGGTWSHTFTVAGSYGYVCTVHPGMTAQLVVRAARASTPPREQPTHQHGGSAPVAAASSHPPASTTHAHPQPHASKAAPAATSSTPRPPAETADPAGQAQPAQVAAATDAGRPLDPLLVLASLVAGFAVLCLLLVGSRSATAPGRGAAGRGAGDGRQGANDRG